MQIFLCELRCQGVFPSFASFKKENKIKAISSFLVENLDAASCINA